MVRPEQLTRILEGAPHPLGIQEILRAGGMHPGKQTEVKRALRDLVRQGEVRKEGKRFAMAEGAEAARPEAGSPLQKHPKSKASQNTVEGILHLHPDGYGFVHPPGEEAENIFLPPEQARRALDGDRVVVAVVPGRDGRTQGRLLEVRDRIRQQVVGTYVDRGGETYVQPNDATLPRVRVARTQLARDGDVVKVRLGVGHGLVAPGSGLFGEVTGSLGRPGEPSAEVLSIAYSRGFSDEFPSEVMDQADAVGLEVTAEAASGEDRRDLRQLPLVTIDGEDARDFDDAVYAEARGDGWQLVVAIADVSHYVKEGPALDAEALRRATSVYLPDRVLPMLPERLSAGICSLKPNEDRLCMVADMAIDRGGRLGRFELYPAVMRSAQRCTYNLVQEDLDRGGERFRVLMELARTLMGMREQRGSIDFDIPETRIVLDAAGKPLRMERRERQDAHRLIEECMLAANEAVAKYFQDRGLPSVYRFHGEPDEEKLATFSALARAHGFGLPEGRTISSKELNDFVQKLEGHPERRALNQLLLRSMMQAVYSAKNVGHYGLAAEHYLHFTSPIRRYPDLLVHRLLKAEWARRGAKRAPHALEQETDRLEQLAQDCSERERAAMQVEREVVSFYATLLMKDRVGEEFEAVVSSMTDFGFFVELDALFIEGLVKGDTLGTAFKLDKVLHQLVYPNGRKVRVGTSVRVRLVSANTARRQLDFEVVRFEQQEESRSPHPGFDRLRALASRAGAKPESRSQPRPQPRPQQRQKGRPKQGGKPGPSRGKRRR